MANSPAESEAAEQRSRKITFQFCRDCSNMLYPKEDPVNNRLMYACRTCPFGQPAESACIYRNELSNTVGDTAGITQDVGSDPTVGLPGFCSCCGDEIICPMCDSNCGLVDEQAAGERLRSASKSTVSESEKVKRRQQAAKRS